MATARRGSPLKRTQSIPTFRCSAQALPHASTFSATSCWRRTTRTRSSARTRAGTWASTSRQDGNREGIEAGGRESLLSLPSFFFLCGTAVQQQRWRVALAMAVVETDSMADSVGGCGGAGVGGNGFDGG